MKLKKIILISISIILIIWICKEIFTYYNDIDITEKKFFGIDNIENKEEDFNKEPTISLAFELMSKYKYFDLIKDDKKAIFYGKKAIELGANERNCGFLINAWLASLYHKKNNLKLACYYYNDAKSFLNKDMQVNDKIFEEEGLDSNFEKRCQRYHEAKQKKQEKK